MTDASEYDDIKRRHTCNGHDDASSRGKRRFNPVRFKDIQLSTDNPIWSRV
jgi:hypothetical protein